MYEAAMVTVGRDLIPLTRDALEHAPSLMNTAMKRNFRRIRRFALDKMRFIPANKPGNPFIWSHTPAAQAKARAWWFQAIKDGRVQTDGEHYIRTGKMAAGWDMTLSIDDDGGLMRLFNENDRATFVNGVRQIPSHADTGWPDADLVVLETSYFADDIIADTGLSILY
jgi:hypothetical protein